LAGGAVTADANPGPGRIRKLIREHYLPRPASFGRRASLPLSQMPHAVLGLQLARAVPGTQTGPPSRARTIGSAAEETGDQLTLGVGVLQTVAGLDSDPALMRGVIAVEQIAELIIWPTSGSVVARRGSAA
jgi:hypothetical protein